MARYHFRAADPDDDGALRARMAADWMSGPLSLSFRREPSYFAGSALQGEAAQVQVCVDSGSERLVGMGARVMTRMFINGEPRRVGLLSDLRLAPEDRGGTLVARGYKVLRRLHEADPVDFYLTVILDGNRVALQSLASGRAGLPTYRNFGRMLTPALFLDLPRAALPVSGVHLRRANEGDERALLELQDRAARRRQFARVPIGLPPGLRAVDYFVAERGSRLVAALAAWDQQPLRQTHIEAYSPWLAALRPLMNAAARWLPLKPMPSVGDRIPFLYLASVAMLDDDLELWRGLLRHAYRELRRGPWHYAITALHESDPMAAALRDYRSIAAAGRIFVVHYADGAASAEAIDRRTPYLDMARI